MEDNKQQYFQDSLIVPFMWLAVLWVIEFAQFAFEINLAWLGVYPKTLSGSIGIFTAPLIHANFSHLVSNSIPLFVLSSIVMYFYRSVALRSFALIWLLTGIAVWIFARPVYHIGASGVVYGLVAFIFWNGIFVRNLTSMTLALIVLLLYSGMFMGIAPNQDGISWESHLLGGIAGIITSFLFKNDLDIEESDEKFSWENEEKQYFLDRDTFEDKEDIIEFEDLQETKDDETPNHQEDTTKPPFDWTSNSTDEYKG